MPPYGDSPAANLFRLSTFRRPRFVLKQSLERYDFYICQVEACDVDTELMLSASIPSFVPISPAAIRTNKPALFPNKRARLLPG